MSRVSSCTLLVIGMISLSDQTSSTKPRILTPSVFRRIINGYKAEIDWVPYFVYVTVKHGKRITTCGGSLISSRWVVTAAHCLHKNRRRVPDENITLYAGTSSSDEFDDSVQMRHVISSAIYDDWANPVKNQITNHDIALLKTCTAIVFTREMQPIALARSNYRLPEGAEALACGFGDTKTTGPATKSDNLHAVLLKKRRCRDDKPADTILCFEGINSPMAGICHGDSGGPLMFLEKNTPVLVGVASGTACKHNIGGGSFTEVSLYRNWIRHITGV